MSSDPTIFPQRPVTVRAARARMIARLRREGVADAEAAAEFALARRLGCRRTEVTLLHGQRAMDGGELDALEAWTERLARHEPLAHVLGTAEFLGREFLCDARALVPRPETELLVERALACSGLWKLAAPELADIGTGTACIAATIAAERPRSRVTAVEADPRAEALARENLERLDLRGRVRLRHGDLLDGFASASLDAVVANLPYVPTGEIERLDRNVREYDPRAALDGGADGLRLIARLIEQAPAALRRPGWIFLEIGEDQGERVAELLCAAGFTQIAVHLDLAHQPRVVEGAIR